MCKCIYVKIENLYHIFLSYDFTNRIFFDSLVGKIGHIWVCKVIRLLQAVVVPFFWPYLSSGEKKSQDMPCQLPQKYFCAKWVNEWCISCINSACSTTRTILNTSDDICSLHLRMALNTEDFQRIQVRMIINM